MPTPARWEVEGSFAFRYRKTGTEGSHDVMTGFAGFAATAVSGAIRQLFGLSLRKSVSIADGPRRLLQAVRCLLI